MASGEMHTPAELKKLGSLLDEAASLESRRKEIIEQVIQAEQRLHNIRIGHLQDYFREYDQQLATITKKGSPLAEDLLLLENLVSEFKFAANDAHDAANELATRQKDQGGGGGGGSDTDASSSSGNKKDVENKRYTSDTALESMNEPKSQEEWIGKVGNFFQKNPEEQRNATTSDQGLISSAELAEGISNRLQELHKNQTEKRTQLEKTLLDLEIERYELKENHEMQVARLTELRISKQQEAAEAELAAQQEFNRQQLEVEYAKQYSEEAGDARYRELSAKEDQKSMQALDQQMAERRAKLEYEARKKRNGQLLKQDLIEIEKKVAKEKELKLANLKDLEKERHKAEQKANADKNTKAIEDAMSTPISKENNLLSKLKTLNDIGRDEETDERSVRDGLLVAAVAVSNLAKQLEHKIDQIGSYKGEIDTRLHGSNSKKFLGSYWDQIVRDMTKVGAINPFYKQEDFANNIKSLVDTGIAFDIEQRAFLETIKNKIATTFEVADSALLRLVRIQQADSTAGRLGMEAALNAFLNEMYENTEYLKSVADSVRGSLVEMQALMEGAAATEVEYQVQKWLGSLYSVGMSQDAVNAISQTLGQIGAGQIEGLTNGGAGNLLIMAANDAGLSIADILTEGLDSSKTNQLMQAVVNYLAELAEASKDNKVVQQQLASVFGVKASDLKAATNLVIKDSVSTIFNNSMDYGGMLAYLSKMAGSMYSRTSIAEMMTNFWNNGQYTLAGSMASNPVSYFIYKMAKIVDDAAGGIDLPFLNVMGFGVDLNTTVSDLMRVAAVGAGLLGSIGPLITGLGNSFDGRAMLDQLGIGSGSGLIITPRGSGGGGSSDGGGSKTTSGSGHAGNSSGSDIKDSTIQESEDSKEQLMVEAKEEEEANQVNVLNDTVLKIYELLDEVANGSGTFKVKVEGYGLTKAGGGNTLGGVDAFGGSGGGGSGGSGGGSGGSGVNAGGISGSVNLSGWTTTV